ncbi:MAG: AAA family ATPase [Verrucomicrobia bacterium]|nr:AAA family ATPase [Verrucomicrobiota bacterium]
MEQKLFESIVEFPDPEAQERYASLIGLDEAKERLEKEAESILRPDLLEEWSKKHHGKRLPALDLLGRRPPLIIFAGDVGTGKTELSSTFGDCLARRTGIPVQLFSLSLRARGAGFVGDMTKLITEALQVFRSKCPKAPTTGKKPTGAAILLIDEADSLAQSRELAQMHHEEPPLNLNARHWSSEVSYCIRTSPEAACPNLTLKRLRNCWGILPDEITDTLIRISLRNSCRRLF